MALWVNTNWLTIGETFLVVYAVGDRIIGGGESIAACGDGGCW